MPASAEMAGVGDPGKIRRNLSMLANRHELKANLQPNIRNSMAQTRNFRQNQNRKKERPVSKVRNCNVIANGFCDRPAIT